MKISLYSAIRCWSYNSEGATILILVIYKIGTIKD